MPLFSLDGDEMEPFPHRADFDRWTANMSKEQFDAVIDALNDYLDDKARRNEPVVSSFIPGPNWNGTPYQEIYNSVGHNWDRAKLCFGQFVWYVMTQREETWYFKPGDGTGREYEGKTYFMGTRA